MRENRPMAARAFVVRNQQAGEVLKGEPTVDVATPWD